MFSQSSYIVNENDGSLQPVLVLSNPASTDITLVIEDISHNASGMYVVPTYMLYVPHIKGKCNATKVALCNHL